MDCLEFLSDIIKIEAYKLKEVVLPIPFTHNMTIKESAVSFSGVPVVLSLKENTAEATCAMVQSESGDLYKNTLSWQTDDNNSDTLQQISRLSAERMHYIVTTYGGRRKLLYNWCGFGRTLPNTSLSGSEETISMSFSIDSRLPILTLI